MAVGSPAEAPSVVYGAVQSRDIEVGRPQLALLGHCGFRCMLSTCTQRTRTPGHPRAGEEQRWGGAALGRRCGGAERGGTRSGRLGQNGGLRDPDSERGRPNRSEHTRLRARGDFDRALPRGDCGTFARTAASRCLRPGSNSLHAGYCCALQAFVVAPASRSDKRRFMAIVSAATIALAVTALVFVATGSVSALGKKEHSEKAGQEKATHVQCTHGVTAHVRARKCGTGMKRAKRPTSCFCWFRMVPWRLLRHHGPTWPSPSALHSPR